MTRSRIRRAAVLGATLSLSALALAPVLAQAPGGPGAAGSPQMMQRRQAMMAQQAKIMADLKLTAAQKAKMQKIGQERQQKIMAVYQDPRVPQAAKRQQMIAVYMASQKKIMALLTPTQQATLKADINSMRAGMGGPGGAH